MAPKELKSGPCDSIVEMIFNAIDQLDRIGLDLQVDENMNVDELEIVDEAYSKIEKLIL